MLKAKIIGPHTHFCDIKIHALNHYFFLCYESPICCVLSSQKEMGFIYHMRCQLSGFGVKGKSNSSLGAPSSTHQERKFSECCHSYLTCSKVWHYKEIQEAKPKYANWIVMLERSAMETRKRKARQMGEGKWGRHPLLGKEMRYSTLTLVDIQNGPL